MVDSKSRGVVASWKRGEHSSRRPLLVYIWVSVELFYFRWQTRSHSRVSTGGIKGSALLPRDDYLIAYRRVFDEGINSSSIDEGIKSSSIFSRDKYKKWHSTAFRQGEKKGCISYFPRQTIRSQCPFAGGWEECRPRMKHVVPVSEFPKGWSWREAGKTSFRRDGSKTKTTIHILEW